MNQVVENTLREMFVAREYSLFDSSDNPEHYMMSAHKKTGGDVHVFGVIHDKLSIGLIKEYIAHMSGINCTHFIVVYGSSVTPPVKKLVEQTSVICIELFSSDELGYNVTKHVLVPTHTLATRDEYAQVRPYIAKIPRILASDPVVRFLGFARGSVVKVVRKNGVVLFRVVV